MLLLGVLKMLIVAYLVFVVVVVSNDQFFCLWLFSLGQLDYLQGSGGGGIYRMSIINCSKSAKRGGGGGRVKNPVCN